MYPIREHISLVLFLTVMITDTEAHASAAKDRPGLSMTPGSPLLRAASVAPTTKDTSRRLPMVTTAPPLNIPHQHSPYHNPSSQQPPLGPWARPHYGEGGRGVGDRRSPLPFSTGQFSGARHMAVHGSVPRFPVTPPLKSALAGYGGAPDRPDQWPVPVSAHTPGPPRLPDPSDRAAQVQLRDTERPARVSPSATATASTTTTVPGEDTAVVGPLLLRKGSSAMGGSTSAGSPGGMDEGTTPLSPASCNMDFGGPQGVIQALPQAISTVHSATDCTYKVIVYMGYGVEIQVLQVNLSESDHVTFEDAGGGDDVILANRSILTKGLVVRSRSNQFTIHLSSQRPWAGSLRLHYQVYALGCTFPQQPTFGDVSVSSLHVGGEAFFSCQIGYQLQGFSTLACQNATTPYWSGREPQCLAVCGGMFRNVTVGRIVSPGFPDNYSHNLTCRWLLEAAEGHRLHIHFEKVSLAEDDDRLLIRNGKNMDASALYDSYEVEYLPNEGLVSTSRHLFIELTTDAAGTSTGMAIRYQAFSQGHCYEPFVKYGNLSSSDTTWAVGAVVEFSCDPGYTLEQGSITIECMGQNNPQWNETEPACRAVCSGEITESAGVVLSPNWPETYDKGQDCIWGIHVEEDKRIMLDINVLNIGQNDMVTFYDGDDLTAKVLGQYGGSRPRFKLYTSTADVTIQFQSDPATNIYGYGNGFVVHFFEVPRNDTCPELPEISNGWKSSSHPELVHGTVVTYQCYPGYQVVGSELLICQWDLTWSGDLPGCERVVSCTDPGLVAHSRRVLTGPHLNVGSTILYICSKGFTLSGNSLVTCYNHGSSGPKWNQQLPRCLPEAYEPCSHPGTPIYGVPSSDKGLFKAGESLQYSCLVGHMLLGEPALRCVPGHPSQWSGLPPVCKSQTTDQRFDVAKLRLQGVNVVFAVFIPVTVLFLLLIAGIYLYFSNQGKSLPVSSTLPYSQILGESAFDSSVYETMNIEESGAYEVSI
ncbi:seizure protein 6 homolog isoform X2 [Gadus macrocephalus]|uniref:seizure protein 6 homolog isoform X2 n=1 Tax=Gadus macrocephalus TaxID=80720 RepID=UPI0028CB9743|nr:seizure protein 6 homolog isoform X2 [Gadus macrocephalus]